MSGWNSYPGQQGQNPYPPPGGSPFGAPPQMPGFPSAPGFPGANVGGAPGYSPSYNPSYAPPSMPGAGYGSYPPQGGPPGPPQPGPPPPNASTYPGQHQNRPPPFAPPPTGGYPPQSGPPSGGFPTPGGPTSGSYVSPSGPLSGGYPGATGGSQGWQNPSGTPSGGYPNPSGPPSGGYPHPAGPPPGGYSSPSGPPSSGYSAPSGPPSGGYGAPSGPPPTSTNRPGGPPPAPPRPANTGYQSGPPAGGYAPPAGAPHRPPTQEQHYGPTFEGANHQRQQPFFQYSQCTGKKKALCIGINYFGQQAELRGCINDARNVQRFLCTYFGYKQEDIVMLTDDATNARQKPTKQNMLQAMQWLVRDAKPNDSLFFHYSGHGGQTKDSDGDEADGFDETIYPVDFKVAGHIVDDQMHDIMVKPLPPGCRLTAIFDSCHSGSVLDLPYIYSTEGKIKEPNLVAEAGSGLMTAVTSYARGDMGGVFSSMTGIIKTATGSTARAQKKARSTRTSPADVISWSGCKDSQTSADAVEAGQATGAMSYAFISALSRNQQQSYQQLLQALREILRTKYSQKPQLSSSHPMDTSILFIC